MEIDPANVSPRDRYKLMIRCIVPRPIAFVSTIAADGRHNLAPFSFFTGISSNPMSLLFCPINHPDGTEKDTLRSCKPTSEGGTGEFVVNVARHAYARQVAAAGEPLPFGESEFNLVGLTPAPSLKVKPPRVAESPVAFECRTLQVVRLNAHGAIGGNVVIGEIIHIHIDDELIDERWHVDPAKLDLVARMGGFTYCTTRDRFDLPPNAKALEQPPP